MSNVAPCNAAAGDDVIESTVNAGSSSHSYDPSTDTYTYLWKDGQGLGEQLPGYVSS
jgi:hypothetical protein